MSTILIADDEARIRRLVSDFLKRDGHTILEAADGKAALELIENRRPTLDLAILDVMMPGMDGFEVLREIREQENGEKHLPVMLLTARAEDADQVRGLESGADDYVTKPFVPMELLARVHSHLRRYEKFLRATGAAAAPALRTYVIGGLELCEDTAELTVDGTPVKLTPLEFKILALLMKNPGRVFSAEEIYERVWNERAVSTDTIMVHIRNIREKIEYNPREPKYLKVVWGIGYKIEK